MLSPISNLKIDFESRPLIFKKPAQTSRDTLIQKPCYYLRATTIDGRIAIGECSLIPGLSRETEGEAVAELERLVGGDTLDLNDIETASVRFAAEMILNELHDELPETGFSRGAEGMDINGLVWMGSGEEMLAQVEELKSKGFKTIKLKIGALDFEDELQILKRTREICPYPEYALRLDANGAFGEDVLEKLEQLSHFDIHSLEQPIAAGQTSLMHRICQKSPIPIALDEELIGINDESKMAQLLDAIKPQFIILKPSLLGGLDVANKWIDLAEARGISWWSTSALESNIGLQAIADWTAHKAATSNLCVGVSGLGTGSLFTNNTPATLKISEGKIWHVPKITVDQKHYPLTAEGAQLLEQHGPNWTSGIADFLEFWFNTDAPLTCSTSGSTGEPKLITHSRQAATHSAQQTLTYFDLTPGDSAVLALPIDFIAGKMMLVRAIVGDLNLIAINPSISSPLPKAQFAALTPHQALKAHVSLNNIDKLLLGGSPTPTSLITEGLDVYEGFGMTETITHIALRKHGEERFTALPGVELSTEAGRLIINSPQRGVHSILTDDLAEVKGNEFIWLGRHSDTINSGGLKFNPEKIEEKLRTVMDEDLAVYGVDHEEYGQCVALRIDIPQPSTEELEELIGKVESVVSDKERPRVFKFGLIHRNTAGKILRKEMAKDLPVIVFATGNPNKAKEVARLLEGKYIVKSLPDIGCNEDIPETADTLEGNAALKARYVKENYGYDCFADDTGLEVKALNGAPGVYTARYGGPEKNADANMSHLLSELDKAGSNDRSAQFRTAIHIITGDNEKLIEGVCSGKIALEKSGIEGFGYDPVFIPINETRTFSEMTGDEKNKISHRGIAIREMLDFLSSLHQ